MSDDRQQSSPEVLIETADAMIRADGLMRVERARERGLLKAKLAHWEVAELFQHCLPLAIHDALRQADFQAFHTVWLSIVGEDAAGWLPPLYLAAVASPCVVSSERRNLVESALAHVDGND